MRVRPATFEDAAAIAGVHARNGMGELDQTEWRKGWECYPFREEFRDVPTGWVLETDDGEVVGSLDNVQLLYDLGGRRLKATIAAGWAVDTKYRGKSLQLMTTFFRQKGVDLLLNVSASGTAAEVLTGLKIPRIPIPDYGSPCFWAVRPRAFARAALERKSVRRARILSWPAGVAVLAADIVRGSGRGRLSSPVRRVAGFDDRFDDLWRRIAEGPLRLRAVRTRAVLAWRFRVELRGGRAVVLVSERQGALSGYAVLVRRIGGELGMNMYDVADLQVAGDDAAVTRDLLLGAVKAAREEGADALKFMSGTPAKRGPANALRPYTYQLPFWQQYHKVADKELAAELATADKWDFSLFETY